MGIVLLISKGKIQQWMLKNNTEAASIVSGELTFSQMVHWTSGESQPLCEKAP